MKKTLKSIACQTAIFGAVTLAIGLSQATVSQANQSLFAGSPITIDTTVYSIVDRSGGGDVFHGDPIFGYTNTDFTGYYIGTVFEIDRNLDDPPPPGAANNSEQDMMNLISYYLDTPIADLDFDFEKVDAPDTSSGNLEVTYDPGSQSGTWLTTGGPPPPDVNFYFVKGSTEFAMYWVDPAQDSGDWVTRHLLTNGETIPGISHLSVNFTEGENPPEVPEPMTMLLFGTGLAGLAGARRRTKKQ